MSLGVGETSSHQQAGTRLGAGVEASVARDPPVGALCVLSDSWLAEDEQARRAENVVIPRDMSPLQLKRQRNKFGGVPPRWTEEWWQEGCRCTRGFEALVLLYFSQVRGAVFTTF